MYPGELVAAHVRRFNAGVKDGDWQAFGAGFAAGATVAFAGVPVPPLVGRDAIVVGYRSAPPDDTITVLSSAVDGDAVSVVYAWDIRPDEPAGTFDMRVSGGLITRLTVRLTA